MLKGNKILLRPLEMSDIDFLFDIENNTENWKFGSENKSYSREELLLYIKNAKIDIIVAKQYRFVIAIDNDPIGFIDLFNYKITSAEVGIIIKKNFRRHGFGFESLSLVVDYAFNVLKLDKLYSTIIRDNINSIRLFNACGFTLDSTNNKLNYFIKLA